MLTIIVWNEGSVVEEIGLNPYSNGMLTIKERTFYGKIRLFMSKSLF